MALSRSENVADASFSAPAASPEVSAARILRTDERTCVRFIRFTAARRSVCRIFFSTDFVFFLCFTAAPCAIQYSFVVYFESSRISDPRAPVNFAPQHDEVHEPESTRFLRY